MKYTFEKAVNGSHGMAIYVNTLTALNFNLAMQLSNHPALKMPVDKPISPDDLRDPCELPELEISKQEPVKLDSISDALLATAYLLNLASTYKDYDPNTGRETTPFAYVKDRILTPYKAIQRQYEWRADMAAKVATEQAALIGIKDSADIGNKAKERSNLQNKEKIAYALAELDSIANYNLRNEPNEKLIEILVDLDGKAYNGLLLSSNLANASMENARKRLANGQYVNVDVELALFAKAHVRDDKPD